MHPIVFSRPQLLQGKRQLVGELPLCHCEQRRDEAISIRGMGDYFASLAMTGTVAPTNGSALPVGNC
jgi:hypothetical protein